MSRRSDIRDVETPLAVPEFLLGISRTIMMALAMLVIAALIATGNLGQETYMASVQADAGCVIVAGIAIGLLAIARVGRITARFRPRSSRSHACSP